MLERTCHERCRVLYKNINAGEVALEFTCHFDLTGFGGEINWVTCCMRAQSACRCGNRLQPFEPAANQMNVDFRVCKGNGNGCPHARSAPGDNRCLAVKSAHLQPRVTSTIKLTTFVCERLRRSCRNEC